MGSVLRIICVDPHPVVCAGLTAIARDEAGVAIVGHAADAEAALELAAARRPDLVILDPESLGPDGFALGRRLKAALPAVRVVLYTARAGEIALQARVAGADGLLDKSMALGELWETVRVIGRGGSFLPPLNPAELEAAAHRVEPEDLALLAMLADRTPAADVADTLRVDRRGLARRIERMLPKLRNVRPYPA